MANNKQQPPPSPSSSSHQQQKNDKKQRKLTKSPQVSCDISMLSSSPTLYGLSSTSSFSFASPKYVAYPSSLPNHHYDDECLMKNFEYLRSDLTLTTEQQPITTVPSPISLCGSHATTTTMAHTSASAGVIPLSPKIGDDVTILHHYPNVALKNSAEQYQREHGLPESLIRNNDVVDHQKPCVVAIANPVTIPTCCLKTAHASDVLNRQHHTPLPTQPSAPNHPPPLQPTTQHHIQTSPLSSAPSILNDQLRHIKQMFQSSSSTSTPATKDESSSINHHNPFTFGNIFKSCDRSTSISPQTGTPQKPFLSTHQQQAQPNKAVVPQPTAPMQTTSPIGTPATAPITSSSLAATSSGGNNSLLTENVKRDEFLKATMKICLVVSPPSNKLLQVHKHTQSLALKVFLSCVYFSNIFLLYMIMCVFCTECLCTHEYALKKDLKRISIAYRI